MGFNPAFIGGKMKTTACSKILLGSLFFILAGSSAFAGAFRIYAQSASAGSEAESMAAHYEDASSMFYNAANLTKAPNGQAQASYMRVSAGTDYENGAVGDSSETLTFHIPNFHFAFKLSDKLSLGLSTLSPFGLGVRYDDDWAGRYYATETFIETQAINPNIAYKLTPSLAVGVGFSYMKSDFMYKRQIDVSPFPSDAGAEIKSDGHGWGFNLGTLWDVGDRIHLGAAYRSAIKVEYDGDVEFNIPTGFPAPQMFMDQDIETEIEFPAVAAFGLAYDVSDDFVVELGADWTQWSSYGEVKIKFEDGSEEIAKKDYRNSWVFRLGGSYAFSGDFLARLGYFYDMSPVPEESLDPMVPSSNMHGLAAGIRYSFGRTAINLGYQGNFYKTRSTNNSRYGLDGDYDAAVNILAGSVEVDF